MKEDESKESPIVLLVDDEPVGLRIVEYILQREGFTIITADNGPQARKLAVETQPDIILLDILMPEEDGF